MDATPLVGKCGIIHGVELSAGEMPAIEPDEDRSGVGLAWGLGWAEECVDVLDETGSEGGFPGCGDACDGNQETRCGGEAGAQGFRRRRCSRTALTR